MSLAFCASQRLDLPVSRQAARLPDYLAEEERVLGALLDSRQLTRLGPGRYRYMVTSLQVFQLQVKPLVSLEIQTAPAPCGCGRSTVNSRVLALSMISNSPWRLT